MAAKKKKKEPAIPVPQTQEEAEALLHQLGELDAEIAKVDARFERLVSGIRESLKEIVKGLDTDAENIVTALHAYVKANRKALFPDEEKSRTAQLTSGEISLRWTPKSVNIAKADDVVAFLSDPKKIAALAERFGDDDITPNSYAIRLDGFLRRKPELNKEAMLADEKLATEVPGVSIVQYEEVIFKPGGGTLAHPVNVESGKRYKPREEASASEVKKEDAA